MNKKAGIMESKLIQILLLIVFLVVAIVLYVMVTDASARDLKNIFNLF